MEKILIGVGCSHTQGCAVQLDAGTEFDECELATPELKKLYGKEKVSTEWITENFSWVGHLGKLLNVDKVYNFGVGGRGLEANIRMLRNYSFRVKDLSNHLIVLQIPSLWRIEVLKIDERYGAVIQMLGDLVSSHEGCSNYLKYYHDEDFHVYRLINELYFLQDYMEKLGAKFYCTDIFSPEPAHYPDKEEFNFYTEDKILNWSSEITKNIKGEELLKNINFIELNFDGWRNNKDWDGKSSGFGSNKTHCLHSEGLLKDDMHLSELGNKKLAVGFYEALKDEKLFSS